MFAFITSIYLKVAKYRTPDVTKQIKHWSFNVFSPISSADIYFIY